MKKFRVETKQANSDIWNGECEIIEAESALEAAVLLAQWMFDQMTDHTEFTTCEIVNNLSNTQFRVSNPKGYSWFGKVFNYSDIK